MSYSNHSRWAVVIVLAALALMLALFDQVRPIVAQPEPAQPMPPLQVTPAEPQPSDPPEPRLQVVAPGSPLMNPPVDARPLLDARRATGSEPGYPLAEQSAKPKSRFSTAEIQEAVQEPGTGLSTTPPPEILKRLEGTRGLRFDSAIPSIAPQQIGPGGPTCQQMLYNPKLDYGTAWYQYWAAVGIDRDAYYTPPNSFIMVENNDGVPSTGTDIDGFGQPLIFPATANSFEIDFKVAYGAYSSSDTIFYAFYYVNVDGSLGSLVAYGTAPKYPDGYWHPVTNTVGLASGIPPLLQGEAVALIFVTGTDGVAPYLDVSIDDVALIVCGSDTVPTGRLGGSITQLGAASPLSDSLVLLTFTPSSGSLEVIDYTIPQPNGAYAFDHLGALGTGDQYQIRYLNDGTRPDRMSLWAGQIITRFEDGQSLTTTSFDIKDVDLISPTHEAQVTFPVTFTWASRGVAGDRYRFCLYDLQTLGEVCSISILTNPTFTLNAADLQNISGFAFKYGQRYAWYIHVLGPGYTSTAFAHVGYSYAANAVTFATSPVTPPSNPPPPSGPPPSGSSGADWTVMIYIAGDNNLGDPERYPNLAANLQGQFATLKQLAKNYPKVNLVTLTDFYDNSGTQYCHLKPDGTQSCQQLGEKDTSDPAVLAKFITDTLHTFTATHTMLIISDHGHSIAGVARDETTGPTATMRPDKIRQALTGASLNTRKLDILFYSACLMGSFEAAFDASSFARYMVASSDELWVLSVYQRLLPLLSNPATKDDLVAVAGGIVTAYRQSVDAATQGNYVSSAAYDLSKVSVVNNALSGLAVALSNHLATSRNAINSARSQVQVYDSSGNNLLGPEDAFVDLRHLATLLQASQATSAITTAARSLLNALGPVGGGSSLVIASQQVSGRNGAGGSHDLSHASGLSIYFPNGNNTGGQPTLTNLYLNKGIYQTYTDATQWDEFLRVYVSGGLSGGPTTVESGTQPISGALPNTGFIYLPMIMKR